MIEINLLPGGARKKAATSSARPSLDFAAIKSAIAAKMADAYMIGSIVGGIVIIGFAGWLYWSQGRDRVNTDDRLARAEADSAHFSGVVALQKSLQATHDTLLRQVNLIHSIDEDRYVWPHILEEISRVLPNYTWLTTVTFTGSGAGATNVVAIPPRDPKADTSAKNYKPKPIVTDVLKEDITFNVIGRTVDVQALTRFMRDLEQSPFIGTVTLDNDLPFQDPTGKDVFQFVLKLVYSRPDSFAVHREPLNLSAVH